MELRKLVDSKMSDSKSWNWRKVSSDYWKKPAEEFIPILDRWKENKFSKVLDLGCGIGRHSIVLAENGFNVTAQDLSAYGIIKLKEKIKKGNLSLQCIVADMKELTFPNDSFDCIVAYHTIQHTDLVGIQKVISQIYSILKKDGEAYITFASKNSDSWQKHIESHIDENTLIKNEEPEIGIPHTYLNEGQVQEMLHSFKIIKMEEIIKFLPNKKLAHFYTLVKK